MADDDAVDRRVLDNQQAAWIFREVVRPRVCVGRELLTAIDWQREIFCALGIANFDRPSAPIAIQAILQILSGFFRKVDRILSVNKLLSVIIEQRFVFCCLVDEEAH